MIIKLLRDSRIWHKAGEVVNASPAEVSFLVSVGSAVEVGADTETAEAPEEPVKAETAVAPKKRVRKK